MELWQDSQQKRWKTRTAVAVSKLSTHTNLKNPLQRKYKLERLYISNNDFFFYLNQEY